MSFFVNPFVSEWVHENFRDREVFDGFSPVESRSGRQYHGQEGCGDLDLHGVWSLGQRVASLILYAPCQMFS